jgi:DNA-binding Lrp family transcriptional regulator
VARDRSKNEKISVLKGREAKLNYAIFHILALKGPLTIYDIHKEVKIRRRLKHLRYATVNKRVRALEESGYIKKIGVKKTKAGFEAAIYELTARAYLAVLLSQINMDLFLEEAEDDTVLSALAALQVHSFCPWIENHNQRNMDNIQF